MSVASANSVPTRILKHGDYTTEINFFHTHEADQEEMLHMVVRAAQMMVKQAGLIALNVLTSQEGSRICTYIQWQNATLLTAAHHAIEHATNRVLTSKKLQNQPKPRTYAVVYTDDRSIEGVSVITPTYTGVIFINEITTQPATQDRLLELVIANNELQSLHTPGYRSANFHKSDDGERAVNYSLWDTEEHCIEAVSNMADMDTSLEETVQIASPDFRFYKLAFAVHI